MWAQHRRTTLWGPVSQTPHSLASLWWLRPWDMQPMCSGGVPPSWWLLLSSYSLEVLLGHKGEVFWYHCIIMALTDTGFAVSAAFSWMELNLPEDTVHELSVTLHISTSLIPQNLRETSWSDLLNKWLRLKKSLALFPPDVYMIEALFVSWIWVTITNSVLNQEAAQW